MRAKDFIIENVLDEAPLPPDWDTAEYQQAKIYIKKQL